jgi:hypothetical protein
VEANLDTLRLVARLLVAASFALPVGLVERGPTVCLFRRATGLPCPNCGLARSWSATAHGQLRRGFLMHALGPLAFAGAAAVAVLPREQVMALRMVAARAAPALIGAWFAAWVVNLAQMARRRAT